MNYPDIFVNDPLYCHERPLIFVYVRKYGMLYTRLCFATRAFPCGSFHILVMCAWKYTLSCSVVDKTCTLSCSVCVARACGCPLVFSLAAKSAYPRVQCLFLTFFCSSFLPGRMQDPRPDEKQKISVAFVTKQSVRGGSDRLSVDSGREGASQISFYRLLVECQTV